MQAVRRARSLRPKDFVVKPGCCPWHQRMPRKGHSVAVQRRHAGLSDLESEPCSYTSPAEGPTMLGFKGQMRFLIFS